MTHEHFLRELRCHNSWRPSDGPLSPQDRDAQQQRRLSCQPEPVIPTRTTVRAPQFIPQRPSGASYGVPRPLPRPYDQRLSPYTTHAVAEPGGSQAFKNPNLMPVILRRRPDTTTRPSEAVQEQDDEPEDEQLPQIWNPSIDYLITRTAHDYDMIMNYQRDAEGGQRWTPLDIARIREVGKHLHRDIFALRRWRRVVAEEGDQNKDMMMIIKRDANLAKLQCERVQKAINRYEQKCEFELLRDGVYAQDEDGNFYKPTAPKQYVGEGGFLREAARPSIETMENDTWSRPYDRNGSAYYSDNYRQHTPAIKREFQSPTKRALDANSGQPTRQSVSHDTPRRDHADRTEGGRVSRTHRSPSSGKTAMPMKNEA